MRARRAFGGGGGGGEASECVHTVARDHMTRQLLNLCDRGLSMKNGVRRYMEMARDTTENGVCASGEPPRHGRCEYELGTSKWPKLIMIVDGEWPHSQMVINAPEARARRIDYDGLQLDGGVARPTLLRH